MIRTDDLTSSTHDHAKFLSQEIGPRPPTSVGEARAAQYCFEVLERSGLSPRLEPFIGLKSFGHIYIPPTIGLLISALMETRRRSRKLLSLSIGSLSLATIWGENSSRWRPVLKRMARGASENVVAVIPATGETRSRLVLTAHLDSSRSGWIFSPAQAPNFRKNSIRALWGGVAGIWALLLPRRLRRLIAAMSASVTGISLLLMLQRELFGEDVAGACDNASGISVVLSAADALSHQRPDHTEVWVVLTGCEESDRVGMEAFLDRHFKAIEGAWFLGVDSVAGQGATLRWITRSGLLDEFRSDYRLTHLAEEVADQQPHLGASPGFWRTAGLDTDSAAARGFNAMSLMALTPEGTVPNWHWPTDTFENLDPDALKQTVDFTVALIRRFDQQA